MKDIPRAAINVGEPQKSFTPAEGNEAERRGWDEKMYRVKMLEDNNHYDFSRKGLNFEINSDGKIVTLGSNPIPLDQRLKQRLAKLGFKPYKGKNNPLGESDNSPNFTVGVIVTGNHDVLTRLAFGNQDVDFTLERSNAHIKRMPEIEQWAMDTWDWACKRWGRENIIGFDVHLDETTPHIHIQTIPVAMVKERGRQPSIYVKNDDPEVSLKAKVWEALPEAEQANYTLTLPERKEKEAVSYAKVWGANRVAVGRTYSQMHTEYHDEVGYKYGLERGVTIASLPEEEQREHVHKNKHILEAERQAKEAIEKVSHDLREANHELSSANLEKLMLERQKENVQKEKDKVTAELDSLKSLANAAKVEEKELIVPDIALSESVKEALQQIQAELDKEISIVNYKKWQKERKIAIKQILTDMQTQLLAAKKGQRDEILRLGKAIYKDAQQKIAAVVVENRKLHQENEQLQKENAVMKDKVSKLDANAIESLRKQKNEEINRLKDEVSRANDNSVTEYNKYLAAKQRVEKAEGQVESMLKVPQIKEIWEAYQAQLALYNKQLDSWIKSALLSIRKYILDTGRNIFDAEEERIISMGIIAKTLKEGLDETSVESRSNAVTSLLADVNWDGSTPYGQELGELRVHQLNRELSITSELIDQVIILASGGYDTGASGGGGGSDNNDLRWDGVTQDDIERAIYLRAKGKKGGLSV